MYNSLDSFLDFLIFKQTLVRPLKAPEMKECMS